MLTAIQAEVDFKKAGMDPRVAEADVEKHQGVYSVGELDAAAEGKLTRRFDLFIIPMLGVSGAIVEYVR